MDRYLVISSDTHAGPPTERYREYLEEKYFEAFDADLVAAQQLAGARRDLVDAGAFEEAWEKETGDGGKLASWDPAARNLELDREGIVAEVSLPRRRRARWERVGPVRRRTRFLGGPER